MNLKKITIYIITYNQEDKISRALDSVLKQKEWGLYQIVINDDCSTDRTWEILKEYQLKFPGIIYPHRNERNLGIYGNLAELESLLRKMPSSDLYGALAGDDEYCDGYFEGVQKLIETNDINSSEAIGIYSDWKKITTDGIERIHRQNTVLLGYPLFSLKMRGNVCSRSLLVSKKVRDSYGPMILDRGLNLVESNYDAQPHLHIDKAYYLDQVTSIYYTGVGVSTRLSVKKSDYLTTQSIEKWKFGIENYIKDEKDLHYATYELLKAEYYLAPTWNRFIKMLYHYQKGKLKGCLPPFCQRARMFLGLLKYKISFEKKEIL